MAEIKNYLDLDGLTAYDKKIKAWIKSGTVDITDDEIRALFATEDGVYMDVGSLIYKTLSDKASMPVIEYNEVDLGLPSGLKWSDRNVGAVTPQDNGMFFSWGNTDGVIYTSGNMLVKDVLYKYLKAAGIPEEEIEAEMNEIMSQEGWEEMLKPELSGIGFIEGTTFDETTYATTSGGQFTGSTLDNEHDAATQWMGNGWRMPTSAEINELVENTYQYGVKDNGEEVPRSAMTFNDTYIGMKFISTISGYTGNSIFIPFAGYCSGGLLSNEGSRGCVWSSSVDSGSSTRFLYVDSSGTVYSEPSDYRYRGQSVRGVRV